MIIPEWFFQELVENDINKVYNPQWLRQMARNNMKLDDKQLDEELARKMINPYYFTDKKLQVGYIFTLESHHINQANSKLIIKLNYPEF